jgi:hypothetical protein
MADKDEYQYSTDESEVKDGATQNSSGAPAAAKGLGNKVILIPIILAILVYFYSQGDEKKPGFNEAEKKELSKPAVIKDKKSFAHLQEIEKAKAKKKLDQFNRLKALQNEKSKTSTVGLNDKALGATKKTDSAMHQTKQDISEVQSSVSLLRKEIKSIHNLVLELNMRMDSVSSRVRKLSIKKKKIVVKPKKKMTVAITYTVRAAVHGRAWIRSSDGTEFSVAVGDRVKGYGPVRSIDEITGVVSFSKGKWITFGKNDY